MPTHRRFSLSLVFLLLLMAVSLLPFYIMVSGSLKPSMSFFMVPMDFNPARGDCVFERINLRLRR